MTFWLNHQCRSKAFWLYHPVRVKSLYLSGMLHGSLVELTPVIVCELLTRRSHIKVGAISPLLGQHGPILRTLWQLSYRLLQMLESNHWLDGDLVSKPFLFCGKTTTTETSYVHEGSHLAVRRTAISPESTELPGACPRHVQLHNPARLLPYRQHQQLLPCITGTASETTVRRLTCIMAGACKAVPSYLRELGECCDNCRLHGSLRPCWCCCLCVTTLCLRLR